MVAGQPSSQPVVGDDTGTLADTGSQRSLSTPHPPPREASQEGASGASGVESVAFMLTLLQPPRLGVCVARGEVLSDARRAESSSQPNEAPPAPPRRLFCWQEAVMKSEVKMLCYCTAE